MQGHGRGRGLIGAYADVEDPIAILNTAPDTSGGPTVEEAIEEAGFQVQMVNWVWEQIVGESLVESIIMPITGDFEKIHETACQWENVCDALQAIRNNLNAGLQELAPNWTGETSQKFQDLIGTTWTLGLEADAQAAKLIKMALSKVAEGSKRACDEALNLIRMLVNKLIEAAAMLPIPVVGWGRAVKLVYDGIQLYNAIMRLIRGIEAIIEGAQQVIQGIQQVGSAIAKIKDIRNLNDAINAGNEAGEGLANVKGVDSVKGGLGDVKGGATEAASAGRSAHDNATGLRDERAAARPDGTSASGADGPGTTGGPNGADGRKPGAQGQDGDTSARPSDPNDTKTPQEKRVCENDPIDVVSGEMVLAQTDVDLPGVLRLVLRRTHVSSYRAGRLFGRSWASTLDQRLEFDDEGVVYVAEDGMLLVYPEPPAGEQIMPQAGPRWPLSRTETGFTITNRESGQTMHFPAGDGNGVRPLMAISDRNGNQIDVERDPSGFATAVGHSGGYHIDIDTENGKVTELRLRNIAGNDITLLRYRYNNSGDLAEVLNSSNLGLKFDYDEAGRITQWTDRNGEWYRYFYDDNGRCIANQGSGGYLNGTFSYDVENRTTRFTDALGNITVYQLDERKNIAAVTDPLGHTTTSEWDDSDRLLSRTDPLGRTTRYEYDEAGNLTTVTRPDGTQALSEYNELKQVTKLIGPDGAVWHRDYDERGNLLRVTNPLGATTHYNYDEKLKLSAITDPDGNTKRIETNAAGLPTAVVDPLGARTHYLRDAFGRVSSVTDANGAVTRYGWTVEGKPAARTHADGTAEYWRYDGEGNRLEHVDAGGRRTHTEVTHFDLPAATVDPNGMRYEFAYDTSLRLIGVRNPASQTWQYEYDAAGNLIRETDFSGRTIRYEFDAAGQLVSRTNGAGEVSRFQRDQLGRIARRESSDGTVAAFEYDDAGRMVRAVTSDADVVLQRDGLGLVVAEVITGKALSTKFDRLGRRTERRTPSGAVTRWEHDANHRAKAMHTAGHTINFGYDAAGREVERLLDTGTVFAQGWDARGRLTQQTVSAVNRNAVGTPQAQLIQQRRYHYRQDGALAAIEDMHKGMRQFDVDSAGRVVGVGGSGWVERYAYDSSGQLATATWPEAQGQETSERTYQGGRLHTAGRVRYRYDAQGRVVQRQKKRLSAKPDTWHYEWNAEDRLIGVVTPDGTRWRYRYDALGRRVGKQRYAADGATVVEAVQFIWDGSVLAEEINSEGRARTWDYQPGTYRPITQSERQTRPGTQEWFDAKFYSIVADLVGTPTELVDAQGRLAWRANSTLWGKNITATGHTELTPLRFPGQYHDQETQLHYNYQRYYDAESGRYQSNDPLGLAAGPDPQAYVPNPAIQFDPLGLVACDSNLFRGTSEGYAGSENMQKVGVTPTSTDPAVATVFATQSEQYGNGVVHIASPDDVAGVDRLPPSLGALESEVPLDIPPSEFASRASHTISVGEARAILDDMGVSVPRQVTDNVQLDAWLHQRTPMTQSQIDEFVRRATGG